VVSWFVAQKIDLDFFCQWLGNRQIAPIIFFSFLLWEGKSFVVESEQWLLKISIRRHV
jgi:hypothetical protein